MHYNMQHTYACVCVCVCMCVCVSVCVYIHVCLTMFVIVVAHLSHIPSLSFRYYDLLDALVKHTISEEFTASSALSLYQSCATAEECVQYLETYFANKAWLIDWCWLCAWWCDITTVQCYILSFDCVHAAACCINFTVLSPLVEVQYIIRLLSTALPCTA